MSKALLSAKHQAWEFSVSRDWHWKFGCDSLSLYSLHQLMKIAFSVSPASAWSFLLSLLKCASAQKGARPKALLDLLFCRAWITDSALFSSIKGLCITHRQHLGKTGPRHSCWCIWKGDQCWASCYQLHCFLPQLLREVAAAWNLSVPNWRPAAQSGTRVTLFSALMVAVVVASRDNGELQSTPWQETSSCFTQGCTAISARKSFNKEHML